MASLTDVYDGGVGAVAGRQRRAVGAVLVVAGVAMVVGSIPLATTGIGAVFGLGLFEAREVAGVLAGLGLPAVFVGIFAVLPAGRGTRAAAAIGASLAVLGVALFAHAYPYDWLSANPGLAAVTALLYATGALVTFWCLFVAVATFKHRNDPGGTVRLERTDEGRIRVVTGAGGGASGVALFGREPDGDVDTQTNRPDEQVATAGDGGTAVVGAETTVAGAAGRGEPDRYCGNCRHFAYVRVDGDLVPYCGHHGDLLADMEDCEQWEPLAADPDP